MVLSLFAYVKKNFITEIDFKSKKEYSEYGVSDN